MTLEIPPPGPRLFDGNPLATAIAYLQDISFTDAITAAALGTQAAATPLTTAMNNVNTVAGANDSVMLPPATAGKMVLVANPSAATLDVYADIDSPLDQINGTIGTTAYSMTTGKNAMFFCPADGRWRAVSGT